MANAVYAMCALTSLWCIYLLIQGYRRGPTTLLFWSIVCFLGMAINNILLVVDFIILPTTIDLSLLRTAIGLMAVSAMAFGLIRETV